MDSLSDLCCAYCGAPESLTLLISLVIPVPKSPPFVPSHHVGFGTVPLLPRFVSNLSGIIVVWLMQTQANGAVAFRITTAQ